MNTKLLESMEEFEESKEYWYEKLMKCDLDSGVYAESVMLAKQIDIEEIKFSFSKDDCEKILKLCKNQDSLIFVVFLFALNVLLYKYTKKNNVVTSVPIYADDLQFDYNNFIYVNYEVDESLAIKEHFGRIKNVLSEAYKHQHCLLYNKNTECCKCKSHKVASGNSIVLQKIHCRH